MQGGKLHSETGEPLTSNGVSTNARLAAEKVEERLARVRRIEERMLQALQAGSGCGTGKTGYTSGDPHL